MASRVHLMEMRRERRYGLPVLDVVIGDELFRAINWSMKGILLYGICDVIGARVRGEMGAPGSCDLMPFTATVVRADLDHGHTALCFEDERTERIEFHEAQAANGLQ
jgi:hypothetical protein